MTKQTVWLVGELIDSNCEDFGCQVGGIFDSKEKAIKHCITEDYFVAELKINQTPKESGTALPHSWYPLLEDEPEKS